MARKNDLPVRPRLPKRFNDLIDDFHVEIVLRLVNKQWRAVLEQQDRQKGCRLLARRCILEREEVVRSDLILEHRKVLEIEEKKVQPGRRLHLTRESDFFFCREARSVQAGRCRQLRGGFILDSNPRERLKLVKDAVPGFKRISRRRYLLDEIVYPLAACFRPLDNLF